MNFDKESISGKKIFLAAREVGGGVGGGGERGECGQEGRQQRR